MQCFNPALRYERKKRKQKLLFQETLSTTGPVFEWVFLSFNPLYSGLWFFVCEKIKYISKSKNLSRIR